MAFYIGITDLVANAMIESMTADERKNFVSYREIEAYGASVVNYLMENGDKAVLLLSRDRTYDFLNDYSDYFEEKIIDGEDGIQLKPGILKSDLIKIFRGYLSLDMLIAFVSVDYFKKSFGVK